MSRAPTETREPHVVLVSMPWTTVMQPSLGLGILCAQLRKAGVSCRAFHGNLLLLKYLSAKTYDSLAHSDILNEFLFTAVLDTLDDKQISALHDRCKLLCASGKNPPAYKTPGEVFDLVLGLRNQIIPRFLAECAEKILAMQPTLAGFTCLFDQTIASVAVATFLKERRPELPIALGGYAVQHDNGTEVLKRFPQIDCIARGDGEPAIVPLAYASVGRGSLNSIPSVTTRATLAFPQAAPRADLREALPPDYDDWFEDVAALREAEKIAIRTECLPMESSRGCWWGQRSHCTFCGIDEETLKYRAKSPEQVLSEIAFLRGRYGDGYPHRFSDYIIPYHYHDTLFPELAKIRPRLHLEGEMKANQSRDRLQAFAKAGFVALQPGVESFSTSVLKRMDKGVRAIQNVQLLKWGFLDGVIINYNLLFGFPGDEPEEYRTLVAHMPRLYHLIPPVSRAEVAITRFAPLHVTPERFGITTRPTSHEYYRVLFSQDFLERTGWDMNQYCYYFDRNYSFSDEMAELYAQLVIQVAHWKKRQVQEQVALSYVQSDDGYTFCDTRFARPERFEVSGLAAALYTACNDEAISVEAAIKSVAAETGAARELLEDAIDELDERRIVWQSDGMLVGLGIPEAITRTRMAQQWRFSWPALAPLLNRG